MAKFITPQDVTPGTTGSWQDCDCSSFIPSTATGIIGYYIKAANTNRHGWRENGSTDANEYFSDSGDGTTFCCGVDGSQIFEFFLAGGTNFLYVVGYFESDAVFFTNLTNIETGPDSTWNDYDISGNTGADTAIAAILDFRGGGNNIFGLRKNGSTDTYTGNRYGHQGAIIGVDGSEILEGWQDTDQPVYLQGYITKNYVAYTNGTNMDLGSTGSYIDLTAVLGSAGLSVQAYRTSAGSTYAFRKNGDTHDHVIDINGHGWMFMATDGAGVAEAKIGSTAIDFNCVGYFLGVAMPLRSKRTTRRQVLLTR